MRQALRSAKRMIGAVRQALNPGGGMQVANVKSFPAPVGGWNARDALAAMKPTDAVYLRNWFPRPTDCKIRGGSDEHGTGMSGTLNTLAVYNAQNGTSKMFAASDAGLWNVSVAGAGIAQVATVTNGKFQTVNFGDGTTQFLIMVNGVDKPLYYTGAAWVSVDGASVPALTGLTTTKIVHVMVYQKRLFFVEKDSLSVWYLPAGVAGGALTEFDFSSYVSRGGYLMAMATWSFDGGDGPDDYAAFVTSEGQVLIYRGTDPSDATKWTKVGTYFIGKPLGRRCFVNYGGDLVLITQNGAFPLSKALQSASINYNEALTDKIVNAFSEASMTYGDNFGWEGIVFPAQSAMLFNIPVSAGEEAKQYAMNTITKAWCEFDSWNAQTFAILGKDLYFATGSEVWKAWTGVPDGDNDVVADGKTAFSSFGAGTQEKRFNLFRPVLSVNGTLTFLTGLDVDFQDLGIVGEATYAVTSGALWDVSKWDEAYWAASLSITKNWTSPQENVGYWAAGKLKIATSALEVHWMSHDFVYESGGIL